ncbi:hypothetical protein BH10CYA1_BH10CYA1_53840 [soil metagenome]
MNWDDICQQRYLAAIRSVRGGVSEAAIDTAQRSAERNGGGPLHMVLFQLGLLTVDELNQVFDYLEFAINLQT